MIREYITHDKQDLICNRTSTRSKANGIVALVNFEDPIITRINDIALGGLSFLHGEALHLNTNEIMMDILIFDAQTNIEYFFSHVKGTVKSKECIANPQINREYSRFEYSRFSVEFLELNSLHLNVLQAYFDEVSPVLTPNTETKVD